MIKDTNQDISDYVNLIKGLPYDQRKHMLEQAASKVLNLLVIDNQEKKQLLKEAFEVGLLGFGLIRSKEYDSTRLLNDEGIKWIKKVYSPEEQKALKETLLQLRYNLNSTIERFPN
jgi:hypothetical protein